MKIVLPASLLLASSTVVGAFLGAAAPRTVQKATSLNGYLDDLSSELYAPDSNPDVDKETNEATKAKEEEKDRYGVGDWSNFVDFDEFDGGDGQMGVAGDGKKGLDKEWTGAAQMAKSKTMSAKNAWGRTTGYAETLVEQGVEQSRAQQLENWHNQQEVLAQRRQQRYMTDDFDQVSADDSWRDLSKFGVERNEVCTRSDRCLQWPTFVSQNCTMIFVLLAGL